MGNTAAGDDFRDNSGDDSGDDSVRLLVLLELGGQPDLLLGGEALKGLKFPVEALHLLPQVDVVVLQVGGGGQGSVMGCPGP